MKTVDRDTDEATMMQFEKGYLWEAALSAGFKEKAADRPDEVELDGIAMSPDGLARDEDEFPTGAIEEYKCTLCSAANPPTDN